MHFSKKNKYEIKGCGIKFYSYFVAALSLTASYSLTTGLASVLVIAKPNCSTKCLLHYAIFDTVLYYSTIKLITPITFKISYYSN